MIDLINVTKKFGEDFIAVDNLSFKLEGGKIYGFLGPNGAGKTTTLKMMTGILKADAGTILINGIDIVEKPILAKKQFGFLSDDPDIFLKLTAIEYLNFIGKIYDIPNNQLRASIMELSKKFQIDNVLNDKLESFSHGMRQKVMLIGTLLHRPKIWLLDEPLTGLDPKSSFILKEMMMEHVANGNLVLFSTHVLEVAEKICDIVLLIDKGKLIFQGSIKEMKEKTSLENSLEKMFLELVDDE